MRVVSRWAGLVPVLLLAACANVPGPSTKPDGAVLARVQNGSGAGVVRYDREAGTCDAGTLQLVSRDQFEALVEGWKVGDGCTVPSKEALPGQTAYPVANGRMTRGSAHVLVRLEAEGHIESVRAVCASSADFAEAAERTVSAMEFDPSTCGGVPARAAFMLPLDFAPD